MCWSMFRVSSKVRLSVCVLVCALIQESVSELVPQKMDQARFNFVCARACVLVLHLIRESVGVLVNVLMDSFRLSAVFVMVQVSFIGWQSQIGCVCTRVCASASMCQCLRVRMCAPVSIPLLMCIRFYIKVLMNILDAKQIGLCVLSYVCMQEKV